MDFYYLDSMYLIYVMHADIPSGGFSILYKPGISAGVEAIVNQLLAL